MPSGPGWLVRSRVAGTLSSAPVGRCGVDSRRMSAHVAVDVSPQLIMSSRTLRARNPETQDLFTSPLYTTYCDQFSRGDVGRFELAAVHGFLSHRKVVNNYYAGILP